MYITKTFLPYRSLVDVSVPLLDYADAYTCTFRTNCPVAVADAVVLFFQSFSAAAKALVRVRHALVKPFGLQRADHDAFNQKARSFGPNPRCLTTMISFIAATQNEILLGGNDRHLRFRLSFLLLHNESNSGSYQLTVSTTVVMRNALGRVYFFLIKPFHRLIVMQTMKRMVKQLAGKDQ